MFLPQKGLEIHMVGVWVKGNIPLEGEVLIIYRTIYSGT